MPQLVQTQTNQNNGPLPQQNALLSQRSSPHPQQVQQPVKKVIVQPNNANDMDDLEESITAAIVQKHPVTDGVNIPQQFNTPPPNMRQNHVPGPAPQQHQQNLGYTQHYQQQPITYDQSHVPQHPQPLTQRMMDPMEDMDDERQVALYNGQRMVLTEYKRLQQTPRNIISQQSRYV